MQCPEEELYTSKEFIIFTRTHDTYDSLGKHIQDEDLKRKEFAELVDLFRRHLVKSALVKRTLFESAQLRCKCTFCQNVFGLEKDSYLFSDLLDKAKSFGPEVLLSFIVTTVEAIESNANWSYFLLSSDVRDLNAILECFSSQRFHGWGIRNSSELMVSLRLHYSDSSRIALLIRNGFPYLFNREYFRYRFYKLQKVEVDGKSLGTQISPFILHSGSLRLQLVFDILLVLFGEYPQTKHLMLKLLWRALPFPYISLTEMSTLLEPFFIEGDIKLWDVCDMYRRNSLFKVPLVTQPRSLKHLSRVQVRKCMCDANSIGDDAIDGLDLPVTLKDYLKLLFTETPIPKST